jgi:hypothetical protein
VAVARPETIIGALGVAVAVTPIDDARAAYPLQLSDASSVSFLSTIRAWRGGYTWLTQREKPNLECPQHKLQQMRGGVS